jgi:hypothetical protein
MLPLLLPLWVKPLASGTFVQAEVPEPITAHELPSYQVRSFSVDRAAIIPATGAVSVALRAEAEENRMTERWAIASAMLNANVAAFGASVSAAMSTPCP